MVDVRVGDLFASQAQTLVNTVNCVGVMGKGVALEFKKRFPEMYADYVERCRRGKVKLGEPYIYPDLVGQWVLNFPTKDHWRSVSKLDDIVRGLEYLTAHYKEWGIQSLAVPPLGCGNGQLEWRVVGPTLVKHLAQLDIPVELYAPHGTPEDELQPAFLEGQADAGSSDGHSRPATRIEPAWIALVDVLFMIEREPHHWPVGRTTFQKIAYFATESGLPTGLRFQRGSFGPFSSELKGLITRLANNGLIREERLGSMLRVRVGPTYRDARRAYVEDLRPWRPIEDRLADLFLRIQRTNQAEIAASVHFAAKQLAESQDERPSEIDVLNAVIEWKRRRRPALDTDEAAAAIRHLGMLGWIDAAPSDDLPVDEESLVGV
jgi:O-acetyl-ADP-ribose deacetylase (regulator of RNase III)